MNIFELPQFDIEFQVGGKEKVYGFDMTTETVKKAEELKARVSEKETESEVLQTLKEGLDEILGESACEEIFAPFPLSINKLSKLTGYIASLMEKYTQDNEEIAHEHTDHETAGNLEDPLAGLSNPLGVPNGDRNQPSLG